MKRSAVAYAVAAYLFGWLLGFGADSAGLPLAWVLGPMLAAAILSLSGRRPYAPTPLRRGGQLIVGTAVGLNVTAGVLAAVLFWFPAMVATAMIAIIFSAGLSLPLARLGGVDGKTAYFAMLPGGLSEMANLASAAGARSEPVAVAHALRVAMTVTILPPLILAFGDAQPALDAVSSSFRDYLFLPILLAIGAAGAVLIGLTRFNNPWMIGALIAVAAVTASGLVAATMPSPVFALGQFLVGFTIGSQFTRSTVARLPRMTFLSATFTLLGGGLMFLVALGISALSGADLATMTLATTIGGAAEMAITADALQLNVTFVTAFHVVRATIVNGFAGHIRTALERIGFWRGLKVGHDPAPPTDRRRDE